MSFSLRRAVVANQRTKQVNSAQHSRAAAPR
jgi:hypothetical protein